MSAPREALGRLWRRRVAPSVAPVALRVEAATGTRLHRSAAAAPTVSVYGVYRARNAATVARFVAGLPADRVHLHALDEPVPSLAAVTRSSGPGLRVPLLRSLMADFPAAEGDWVVTTDDDAEFVAGDVARLVALAAAGGLDIAQPAHHPDGFHSYRVTRFVPMSTARLTGFVEVGPVVAFSPRVQPFVLPFPADAGMGWGLDVSWTLLRPKGFRLGVVAATPVLHLGAVAVEYDGGPEEAYQRRWLDAAGVASPHDLPGNLGMTWRPWRVAPPWPTAGVRSIEEAGRPEEAEPDAEPRA